MENKKFNPYAYSTLNDVFRKIDLKLDGMLTNHELNRFGKIVNEPYFQNLTSKSFKTPEFENISGTSQGVTRFGFAQMLAKFDEKKIKNMLSILGYDDSLYSSKSRVFVLTFHSDKNIRIRIGNSSESDIVEKALNIFLADYLDQNGATSAKEDKRVVIFRKFEEDCYATTYAAVNKTNRDIEVTIDMKSSLNQVYVPSGGKATVVIPPYALRFLSASILNDRLQPYYTEFKFSSKNA